MLTPSDFGMEQLHPNELFGGNSIEDAATIFIDVLKGNGSAPQNNVVLANAALGLNLVYPNKTVLECVQLAKESLESGKAFEKLKAITK
jgi:anthranilate phosphoribosyltransferase